jgi:hypothetical protein
MGGTGQEVVETKQKMGGTGQEMGRAKPEVVSPTR